MKFPQNINDKMNLWREGFIPLPLEYIDWHQEQATKAKEQLDNYTIHAENLVDDGWCDGMKFLQLVVEDEKGNLFKIKWSDSQNWYVNHPNSGGWTLFKPRKSLGNT